MKHESIEVGPGPKPRTVRFPDGGIRTVPSDWSLLKPGDAGLTRRVKAATPSWTVKEKVRRRLVSRGVWAARDVIEAERRRLEAERGTEAYAKKQASAKKRRMAEQESYVEDFESQVLRFLDFPLPFSELALHIARAVTAHATPVGSGTVARTKRIPVERRAEAAVIAWMRHQTTAYDDLKIPRERGKRREVRRQLAQVSRELLDRYRRGETPGPQCPLRRALEGR
jgi:hypothetical protein